MNALAQAATVSSTTRVLVVEDSELIRTRLVSILAGVSGVEVVGHAESAADAIASIQTAKPDVVVLDIKLKAGSGIDVLKTIKRGAPAMRVIVLTNYATEEYRKKCLEAGAEYFLDKTNEFEQLRPIIEQLRRHKP
jgi:DNA-binding NarL/FixJ family response regulator